jgi:glycosyltransferase involved in cell wall biosynthesis
MSIPGVTWRRQPDNLDQVRAGCNIFVSTSSKEPFGLSILESLAAGLCVVIPQDSAYWDRQLINNINCIKYIPGSAESLAKAIQTLLDHPSRIRRIGTAGSFFAEHYRAESCYQHIVATLANPDGKPVVTDTGRSYA